MATKNDGQADDLRSHDAPRGNVLWPLCGLSDRISNRRGSMTTRGRGASREVVPHAERGNEENGIEVADLLNVSKFLGIEVGVVQNR